MKLLKILEQIVKKHIDKWDPIGLLEMGAPNNEYDIEIAEIVRIAYRTNKVDELSEHIYKTFIKYFGNEIFIYPLAQTKKIAEKIISEKIKISLSQME